jgi:DNA-binding PadR family transcriptional regulator
MINSMLQFHILKLVDKGYKTGYDICKKLRLQHPKVVMSLIYINLNKLEGDGYLSHKTVHSRIDRKEYALTSRGKDLLAELNSQLKKMMRLMME